MIAEMYDKAAIQAEIQYLNKEQQYPQAVQMYFDYYGLDWPGVEHRFGWFDSGGRNLAGHVWLPASRMAAQHKSNDLVVVVHGYLNHTGQLKHLIGALLGNGYSVGSFDLPGHGLSEGKSAAVGAIEEYTTALMDFARAVRPMVSGRLHLASCSTGSAVCIDGLLSAQTELFDKVALAGPLVRWRGYSVSKPIYSLCRTFTDTLPRIFRNNSSDPNFLFFNHHKDYLHCRSISLDWIKAVYDWNARIEQMPKCNKKILIVQGSRDATVDWQYNLKRLRKKFPAARVEMIKGARHELFNESKEFRQTAIGQVIEYLKP